MLDCLPCLAESGTASAVRPVGTAIAAATAFADSSPDRLPDPPPPSPKENTEIAATCAKNIILAAESKENVLRIFKQ